jgi:hypothetical protein
VKDQYGRYKTFSFYVYPDSGLTVQRTIDKETVNLGDTVTVTFSASVTTGNVDKLTYQWYYYDFEKKKKVLIDGAVQNSFTVENVPVEFEYWCLIIDEFDYPHNYTFNWYSIEALTGCKWPTVSDSNDGSVDSNTGGGSGNSNTESAGGGSGNSGNGNVTIEDEKAPLAGGGSENSSGSSDSGSGSSGGSAGGGSGSGAGAGSSGTEASGSGVAAGESAAASVGDSSLSTETATAAGSETVTEDSTAASGSTTEESVVKVESKNVKATVTVETSSDGKVVSAAAAATKQAKADGSNYKVTLTSSEIKKITKAAGTGSVDITLKAVDESGKQKYKVLVNSKNLKSNKKLYLYSYNSKTKTYTKASSKTYKVSAGGSISVSIKKKGTYALVTATEVKKLKAAKKI